MSDTHEFGDKFLVVRSKDGLVPGWPWFVLGAKDEHASFALRSYAAAVRSVGDTQFADDVIAHFKRFNVFLSDGRDVPPRSLTKDELVLIMKNVDQDTLDKALTEVGYVFP